MCLGFIQSLQAPQVNITNFHTDTRLYTLVLVDPGKVKEKNVIQI